VPSNRINRINEEIMRELSSLLRTVKDPRVQGLISIVRVDTTNDLRYAKVYISVLDKQKDAQGVIEGLRSASGYLRHEVGQAVRLRYTPELIFELDSSISRGAKILDMLGKLSKEEPADDQH
jgi:ribosome-binding factor A